MYQTVFNKPSEIAIELDNQYRSALTFPFKRTHTSLDPYKSGWILFLEVIFYFWSPLGMKLRRGRDAYALDLCVPATRIPFQLSTKGLNIYKHRQ